jgi:hypothetical protein
MPPRKLTVAEAIEAAALIEQTLDAFEQTAPLAIAALGGREELARRSHMTPFGPVPKLTEAEWVGMCEEYEERRNHGDLADRQRSLGRVPRP